MRTDQWHKESSFTSKLSFSERRKADMCDHHHLRASTPAGEIEHVNFLSENIGVLFMNEDYSDIILCVEGQRFHAHKVILAARSEYFR